MLSVYDFTPQIHQKIGVILWDGLHFIIKIGVILWDGLHYIIKNWGSFCGRDVK